MTEPVNATGSNEPAKDTDLDFCGLAVGVPGGDARTEGLEIEQVQRHRFERTCEGIFASIRLQTWYPVQRFQNALPECRVARRVSLRAQAAGQSSFHARPFLRIGMIGVAFRSFAGAAA